MIIHVFPLEPLLESGFVGVSAVLVKVVNEKENNCYQENDDLVFIHNGYLLDTGHGATISISAFLYGRCPQIASVTNGMKGWSNFNVFVRR